jgi:hypothetical protein
MRVSIDEAGKERTARKTLYVNTRRFTNPASPRAIRRQQLRRRRHPHYPPTPLGYLHTPPGEKTTTPVEELGEQHPARTTRRQNRRVHPLDHPFPLPLPFVHFTLQI